MHHQPPRQPISDLTEREIFDHAIESVPSLLETAVVIGLEGAIWATDYLAAVAVQAQYNNHHNVIDTVAVVGEKTARSAQKAARGLLKRFLDA